MRRVLVVEDHPANQMVARYILETQGLAVETADNGRLGVEAWRSGAYDLVLMDLQMPEMDGLTAIRIIRSEENALPGPRTPIAVVSANAMDHHRAEALAAGADIHIAKPLPPQALTTGIAALMTMYAEREAQADRVGRA
ncbi:response regulator [Pseudomonas sp. ODNR1LW]|nr:response regulator [Pseudomonas sp. ODNR1LW]